MRKPIALAAGSALLTLSLAVPSQAQVVPQAPSVSQVQEKTESTNGPFNNLRFNLPGICFLDTVQSSLYRFGDVGNTFEPIIDSGYRTSQQGCGGYGTNGQVLRFALYQAADSKCWKPTVNYNVPPYPGPVNDTYDYIVNGASVPTIWFNTYYASSCFDSEHERVRHLSRAVASLVGGLQFHENCWATQTVMTKPSCAGQNIAWISQYDKWDSIAEKWSYS